MVLFGLVAQLGLKHISEYTLRKEQSIIANTLVNKRGEVTSKEALESMVSQLKEQYIPINIEHDPRIPIQGRVSDAYLRKREDGEYEVVAELDFFEADDSVSSTHGTKKIVERLIPNDRLILSFDRNFNNEIDQENINNISNLLSAESHLSVKNSMDPIGVIEIAAAVTFGGIAKGFLSKIGSDALEATKKQLIKVFARKKEGEDEKILTLSFKVIKNEVEFDVEVHTTNPDKNAIDKLFKEGLDELDKLVPTLYQEEANLHKIVFEYKKEGMEIKYAVNKSCYPLFPTNKL